MKINFSKQQYDYLIINLSKERKDLLDRIEDKKLDKYSFDLNEDLMSLIRDWAGEKLQRVGFDKNYKLTIDGIKLEELIDLLYE
jgi:tRNA A37 N6-isopentenylltransferase MiaA